MKYTFLLVLFPGSCFLRRDFSFSFFFQIILIQILLPDVPLFLKIKKQDNMDESTPCSLEKKHYKDAMDWYYYLCVMLSRVQFFVTPQTAAHQAPLSMEFSRQEY